MRERRLQGHSPEQAAIIQSMISVNFLNNSSSRWEKLVEPWQMELQMSDPINPIFKDNRTRWATSQN